jgi:hypothetical protein
MAKRIGVIHRIVAAIMNSCAATRPAVGRPRRLGCGTSARWAGLSVAAMAI